MILSKSRPANSVAIVLRIISDYYYGSNKKHVDQNSEKWINPSETEAAVTEWNSDTVSSQRMTS